MKTILVATDFSQSAANAVDYAAEMAHVMQAKLILFHACHVPLIGTEIPVEIQTMEETEKRGMEQLTEIADRLKNLYRNQVEIECICKCGFATDGINRYARTKKADLVIMGTQGAGYLAEKLMGSVTTYTINKSTCPLLVINDKVRFHMIKRIVLACDLEKDCRRLPKPLKEMATFFKAHVFVLDVVPSSVLVPSEPGQITDLSTYIEQFSSVEHSFHFWKGENPVDGINDFVNKKNIDMVVMMPHHRPFFKKIFHPSNTKRMTFHTMVPLLVLHESETDK